MDKKTEAIIKRETKRVFAEMRETYPQYSEGDRFRDSEGKIIRILEFRGGGAIVKRSTLRSRLLISMKQLDDELRVGNYKIQNVMK